MYIYKRYEMLLKNTEKEIWIPKNMEFCKIVNSLHPWMRWGLDDRKEAPEFQRQSRHGREKWDKGTRALNSVKSCLGSQS